MQTRRFERVRVSLRAEHVSESSTRPVFIENVSERGMHLVTIHKGEEALFFPGKNIELKLRLSSGEMISLSCEVRWMSAEIPPDGVTDSVGLEIVDPPPRYVSFVKNLRSSYFPQ
jgi:hypothetical protein